jgi:GNAT superfamily N-acetyltransferase
LGLLIRLAQAADRDAVLAFCAHIWDGHDYVPSVWDEWLQDPQGIFLAALLDGVPVAVARAVFPTPDEAWLEGMRVDPDHRGAGIALALSAALVETCRERGARSVRLMTVGDNYPIHRICARLGLDLALRLQRRFCALEAGPAPAGLRQLGPADLPLAQALLARPARGPRFLEMTRGLYSLAGGIWTAWNEARLRQHLARGEAWTWEGGRGARAIAVVNPHRRRAGVFEVGLLEGPGPDCAALLEALHWRAALPPADPDETPGTRMFLPLELSRLHRAARRAGYRLAWRGQMCIFERVWG